MSGAQPLKYNLVHVISKAKHFLTHANTVNPARAMRVLCLCCPEYVAVSTGWSPVQAVLPAVYKIRISEFTLSENRPWNLLRQGRWKYL
jgi:hypothetical protein